MVLTAKIDRDECMSSGKCLTAAPEAFALDDDDLAVVLDGITELDETRLRRIAADCPTQAILLAES